MKILLVGGYKQTWFVTKMLTQQHHKVAVVNDDQDFLRRMAGEFQIDTFAGDGADPKVLSEAGAQKSDAVIAMTQSDSRNLLICRICRHFYPNLKTIAIVSNPDNEEVFRKLDVDVAISGISLIAGAIEERAISGGS